MLLQIKTKVAAHKKVAANKKKLLQIKVNRILNTAPYTNKKRCYE